MTRSARLAAALLAATTWSEAGAAVIEIGPGADVRAAVATLQPGDELVLLGGTYSFNSRLAVTAVGTANQPITIRGKTGETAVIENAPSSNVVEIVNSRYLVLKNLRITGGSHGIRLVSSSFVTLEDNEVYETGDVAISANSGGTYEGLIIRRNHIHHTNGTGEGLYLGCNRNACRVANSIIEWNYIHHTNRASVEQGDGIEVKEGSSGNVIRHNVVHDTNYPGILTYSTVGNGPPNTIEANVIWNTNDWGIQSAADSIIRNNIVLGSGIGLQSHEAGSPSNQVIVHNTIIGAGIAVRNVSGTVVIANNAVYSNTGPAIALISGNIGLVTLAGNVVVGGVSGANSGYRTGNGIGSDFVAGHFNGSPPIDLFPKSGSALINAGETVHLAVDDFNGSARGTVADAGAYRFLPGGNPGWPLNAEFKATLASVRPNAPSSLVAD